jgi:hypothetical protein
MGRTEPAPIYAAPPPAPIEVVANGGPDGMRQLLDLLAGLGAASATPKLTPRHALICVTQAHREKVAALMSAQGYQTYLAANCRQASEKMHDEHMHVVVLDADFAPEERGFAWLSQEVYALRPAQRRRMLLVKLAPNVQTLDRHAAFLQSVNLLVNTAELHLLPEAVERTRRHYNELYKNFYEATNVAPI